MIRRLVQQQKRGFRQQQLGQRQAILLASGQAAAGTIERGLFETDSKKGGLCARPELVTALKVEFMLERGVSVQQVRQRSFGDFPFERPHLAFCSDQVIERPQRLLKDGRLVEVWNLFEHSDAELGAARHKPNVSFHLTGDDSQ